MNDVSLLLFLIFLGYMRLHYAQSKEVYTPSISNLETVNYYTVLCNYIVVFCTSRKFWESYYSTILFVHNRSIGPTIHPMKYLDSDVMWYNIR